MDVPASRLRRKLHPDAARIRHTLSIPIDPAAACQLCDAHERLVVLEPVIDRDNGQRITVAFCLPCLAHAVSLFHDPPPRPPIRGRRKMTAEKR